MTPGDQGTRTLHRTSSGPTLESRRIRIEVLAGPAQGSSVDLPGPEVRIGSEAHNDLVLDDRSVSRHHATLRVEAAGLRVLDAGSRNGTLLDGMRVRDAYARADSLITLGESQLKLRLLDDVVEIPLSTRERFGRLLGASVAMRELFAVLERLATSDATVLIHGETGTGKELVAEAIHDEGARADGPFVVFDCSAVTPSLMESELFGHVKGAFTGAVADRPGAFEIAHGGTLFLDEIGELPLELQPKLLRVLERRQVRRVGANKPRAFDVRIVAATHRALAAEVNRKTFREDLYFRLAVVTIEVPPLRERIEDIPLLVDAFARDLSHGRNPGFSEKNVESFMTQAWPGNVRELRNMVARVLSLSAPTADASAPAPAAATAPAELDSKVDLTTPLVVGRERLVDAYEKAYLSEALREAGGNVTRAAEIAGVNRKFIQRALQRLGLAKGG